MVGSRVFEGASNSLRQLIEWQNLLKVVRVNSVPDFCRVANVRG
jgi:hypothetical protein